MISSRSWLVWPWITMVFFCLRSGFSRKVDIEGLLDDLGWKGQLGQMVQMDISMLLTKGNDNVQFNQTLLDQWVGDYGIGSVLNNHYPWKAAEYREQVILLQTTAQKYGRPPVIWGLDSVHGANYVQDALVTPQPINLAASFRTDLARKAGRMASLDTRRAGIPWLFSPLLGLSWNPYWSRVYETFGEDPLLVGEMAQSMIDGIQEDVPSEGKTGKPLLPSLGAASAKHFVGYSNPHNGHDRAPSMIPLRHLYQYFVMPWRRVMGGKKQPLTVMESYTEIDGVPNVANRRTLDQLLRKELSFNGMVVTDYNEVNNLEWWHHIAPNTTEALRSAMAEGTIDMSMMGASLDQVSAFFQGMEALRSPAIEKRVRTSARRVLELKQNLRMFSESFGLEVLDPDDFDPYDPDTVQAVLEMTRESIVLTKNTNQALPLVTTQGIGSDATNSKKLKILVTGPTSDSLSFQTGGWTGEWQGVNSNTESDWFTFDGYRTVLGALQEETNKFDVTYECGVDILGKDCSSRDNEKDENDSDRLHKLLNTVRSWIHAGNDAGSSSNPLDAIIVCLGEENYTEKPGDIANLNLPEGQYDLVKALRNAVEGGTTNTKIILVYFGGRPRLLADVVPMVDAILIGFLPGPFAGTAIADFLTGRSNPSARLPITYPKNPDLSGIPYLHEVSDMCTNDEGGTLPHWENVPCQSQWPFGHGLSYSRFEYSDLRLSTHTLQQHWHDGLDGIELSEDETLTVTVNVTNVSDREGAETILVYTFDEFRSTTPEYKRLRGYKKIRLIPGESRDVSVNISIEELRFVGPHDDSHYILQNGLQFRLGIGSNTDCRGEEPKGMCSDHVTIQTEQNYVGTCEAACHVWQESGADCMRATFSSLDACHKACVSSRYNSDSVQINNDGWGWNYVQCIEQIVRNGEFQSKNDCWKLTSFCRDITVTSGIDEVGSGNTSNVRFDMIASTSAIVVSIVVGLVASAVMVKNIRDEIQTNRFYQSSRKRGEYGDVEFSVIEATV